MTRSKTKTTAPNLDELAGKLWLALEAAEAMLTHEDPAIRLKAIGAMGAAGSAYGKIRQAAGQERRRVSIPFLDDENPFASLLG